MCVFVCFGVLGGGGYDMRQMDDLSVWPWAQTGKPEKIINESHINQWARHQTRQPMVTQNTPQKCNSLWMITFDTVWFLGFFFHHFPFKLISLSVWLRVHRHPRTHLHLLYYSTNCSLVFPAWDKFICLPRKWNGSVFGTCSLASVLIKIPPYDVRVKHTFVWLLKLTNGTISWVRVRPDTPYCFLTVVLSRLFGCLYYFARLPDHWARR